MNRPFQFYSEAFQNSYLQHWQMVQEEIERITCFQN